MSSASQVKVTRRDKLRNLIKILFGLCSQYHGRVQVLEIVSRQL